MDRLLLRIVLAIGMLPATLLWCWGMIGFDLFVQDAFAGKPFVLCLLISGALGITGVVYLYLVVRGKLRGNLALSLSLILPAWLAMAAFVIRDVRLETIYISLGPIFCSVLLLILCWSQLTGRGGE